MLDFPQDTKNREKAGLIDISIASSSAHAVRVLEELLQRQPIHASQETPVDLQTGSLLLSRSVLLKMKQLLAGLNLRIETVYAELPQTQQAALDEGFFVKEKPSPAKHFAFQSTVNSQNNAVAEVDLPNLSGSPAPTEEPLTPLITFEEVRSTGDAETLPTLYVKQTVRSGKVVRYDGHIVIIGDVHAGSEITASGDIAIWGELRGVAHAGCNGNYRAEIRALRIEALQLRVADYIARRPDRIYYHRESEGETSISAELARVADGEIKIFKEVIGR